VKVPAAPFEILCLLVVFEIIELGGSCRRSSPGCERGG
jgi:hypothetical protein